MATIDPDRVPLEEPLAELRRQLIRAYLAGAGQDLHPWLRDDEEAKASPKRRATRPAG